jgi:low affinity Fe/Cu permease
LTLIKRIEQKFDRFALAVATAAGSPWGFGGGSLLILLWLASGPFFGWGNSWQLIINTTTTIVNFELGFLILYVALRNSKASDAKQDEAIRANPEADNSLIGLENQPVGEIERAKERVERAADKPWIADRATVARKDSLDT